MTAIYLFSFFKMFLVIMPVFVPFLQDLGLSMAQVMQSQAIFALTMACAEIPTGYFADRFGRKTSLISGAILCGLSFNSLMFVRNFEDVLIYEVIIGIGMGLISGADVALMYDQLHHKFADKDERLSPSFSKVSSKAFANLQLSLVLGESIAALMSGFLAVKGMRQVVIAQAAVGWIPLICALFIKENAGLNLEAVSTTKRRLEDLARFCNLVFKENFVIRQLLAAQVVAGLSTFVAVWLLQSYWESKDVSVFWFGILWAALNLTAGLSGKATMFIRETFGTNFVLVLIGATPVLSYVVLAFGPVSLGILFCFGFYISRGLAQVLLREMYNRHIPSEYRATANSFPSAMFRATFALLGPLVGWSVDKFGLSASFAMLAFFFAVTTSSSFRHIWVSPVRERPI